MKSKFACNRRRRKGQALIEFAVSALILIMLMFGMLQWFLIMQNLSTLESAARFAIQEAAKFKFPDQQAAAAERAERILREYLDGVGFLSSSEIERLSVSLSTDGVQDIGGKFRITRIRMDVQLPMNLIFALPSSNMSLTNTMTLRATVKSISEYIEEI